VLVVGDPETSRCASRSCRRFRVCEMEASAASPRRIVALDATGAGHDARGGPRSTSIGRGPRVPQRGGVARSVLVPVIVVVPSAERDEVDRVDSRARLRPVHRPVQSRGTWGMVLRAIHEHDWKDGSSGLGASRLALHARRFSTTLAERLVRFMDEASGRRRAGTREGLLLAFRRASLESHGARRADSDSASTVESRRYRSGAHESCSLPAIPARVSIQDQREHAAISNPPDDPVRTWISARPWVAPGRVRDLIAKRVVTSCIQRVRGIRCCMINNTRYMRRSYMSAHRIETPRTSVHRKDDRMLSCSRLGVVGLLVYGASRSSDRS
jgi:hypothetical protein